MLMAIITVTLEEQSARGLLPEPERPAPVSDTDMSLSERIYRAGGKVGRLPKNAWRATKRERAAQRRKRWMARHPGK
jgi:hypothetical protein